MAIESLWVFGKPKQNTSQTIWIFGKPNPIGSLTVTPAVRLIDGERTVVLTRQYGVYTIGSDKDNVTPKWDII